MLSVQKVTVLFQRLVVGDIAHSPTIGTAFFLTLAPYSGSVGGPAGMAVSL
ncbi:hypothetical protein D9M70_598260 [compost metagenome]